MYDKGKGDLHVVSEEELRIKQEGTVSTSECNSPRTQRERRCAMSDVLSQ